MKKTAINNNEVKSTNNLTDYSKMENSKLFEELKSSINGISEKEARRRIDFFGKNTIISDKEDGIIKKILLDLANPLNILLAVLSVISYLTGDFRATTVILAMIILGTMLRITQERRADKASEKLKALISTKVSVIRSNIESEIEINKLVPGDIIKLSAGDMIPSDIVLLTSKVLFVNQSSLTGESNPVEKKAIVNNSDKEIFDIENICFLGSNVVSGSAIAIVVKTGNNTYFGTLAKSIVKSEVKSSFDKGIDKFTFMMIKFMMIMVPLVFLVNGIIRGDWLESLLFSVAVAVGLTPEMLPMIVSVNLSKGAIMMSKKKVIVKKLNSIQDFGAMDILCTDKTGTITDGKTSLEGHFDVYGNSNKQVLKYGFLNSYFHTGLKNIMDETIIEHGKRDGIDKEVSNYKKIDEIPFDFDRKRMTVVIETENMKHTLVCKGAFEEIMDCCSFIHEGEKTIKLDDSGKNKALEIVKNLNEKGYRVLAIAYKNIKNESANTVYDIVDEKELILLGFLSFFDPPKKTAAKSIDELKKLGISVKILTGDNDKVTKHVCTEVGLDASKMLLASEIDKMNDNELKKIIDNINIFVKLSPSHKERIIHLLQENDHVVGFMGDGINDAPAIKMADVGISVNTATDIAKESSDMILLDNSLLVLKEGVLEGRRVFGNITKYIKMSASSNFGNMFSVVGASAFLPFLPMLPIQVLTNNLLYDFSQTTLPTDNVDAEWLEKPRKWTMDKIEKFVILIGPISSIFDYLLFFIMLYIFNSANNQELFHTGWFIESIFTQSLIIHIIRTNKIPFIESRASKPVIISTIVVMISAILLTVTPISSSLGFTNLPLLYWPLLFILMILYIFLTQIIKKIIIKKFNII